MDTLYVRIGNENLQKLIDQFYDLLFSSEKIAPLFKNDKEEIKEKQYLFLSQFLGGPQLYTDKYGHPKMRARHFSHEITEDAKEEWLKCMKLAIETLTITDDLKMALYNCFPAVAQHMVNQ